MLVVKQNGYCNMCDMQIVIIPLTPYIFTTSDGGENSTDGAVSWLILWRECFICKYLFFIWHIVYVSAGVDPYWVVGKGKIWKNQEITIKCRWIIIINAMESSWWNFLKNKCLFSSFVACFVPVLMNQWNDCVKQAKWVLAQMRASGTQSWLLKTPND